MKIFSEYEDKKLGPEYLNFVRDVQTVLNFGKYSFPVLSTAPNWDGKEGENCHRFETNGTGYNYYVYYWINSGWTYNKWQGAGNTLVPADNSITTAMIQNGAITGAKLGNVYDSGWFGLLVANSGYLVQHNLGTTAIMVKLYWSSSSNGSPMVEINPYVHAGVTNAGGQVANISTSSLEVQTVTNIGYIYNMGNISYYANGYYRVIAMAVA